MLPMMSSSASAPISPKRKSSTSPTPSPASTPGTASPSPFAPFPARTSLPKRPPPFPSPRLLFFMRRGIIPAVPRSRYLLTSSHGRSLRLGWVCASLSRARRFGCFHLRHLVCLHALCPCRHVPVHQFCPFQQIPLRPGAHDACDFS